MGRLLMVKDFTPPTLPEYYALLERVDKLSREPGNRVLGLLIAENPKVLSRANTLSNTFGVWARRFGYGGPALGHGPCPRGNSSRCLPA